MNYIKTLLITSCCLLPILSYAQVVPEAVRPIPKVHPHQERCIACHVDGVDVTKLFAEAGNDCLQCHDPGKISSSLRTVLEEGGSSTPSSTEKAIPKDIGMSLPMYADESRLGDQPNEMILIPAGEFIMGSETSL